MPEFQKCAENRKYAIKLLLSQKKIPFPLHMCNFFCTFVADFEFYANRHFVTHNNTP